MVARSGRRYRHIRCARRWEPRPGGHLRGGLQLVRGPHRGVVGGGGAVAEYCTRAGAGAEYCTGAGTAAEYCTGAGAGAVFCRGAGIAAEYCTGAEECVVGSTVPIRRWGGATGARPAEVYCSEAGAAAEYCTAAEECAVGSNLLVRRGAKLQGLGPRRCTVLEWGPQRSTVRQRRSVRWGPHYSSVGGGGATGARPAEVYCA